MLPFNETPQPKPDWRGSSEKIAEALVRDKFRRNAKAREVLVGTGRVKLVYTNTHEDRFWGVCSGEASSGVLFVCRWYCCSVVVVVIRWL